MAKTRIWKRVAAGTALCVRRQEQRSRNHAILYRLVFLLAFTLGTASLQGCDTIDSIFGSSGPSNSGKTRIEGKRISVLALERQLEPDPGISDLQVALPQPRDVTDWPQPGGTPQHLVGHPALPDTLSQAWSEDIGEGSGRYGQLIASPVVNAGIIYTMDAKSTVSAFDAQGKKLWETDVTPPDNDNQGWGGGIAYDDGHIYVTSGFAQVLALNAADGSIAWRATVAAPIHAAPTVANGRIFFVTVEDELLVVSTKDGHQLWSYEGVPEAATLVGSPSPAISGDTVVVPFASGDVVAMRADNGRVIWSDNLSATARFDAISNLADIRGRPVIDRGRVFAISHSGRMVSIDLRTGERAWEQDVAGVSQPWVAGDFVYVLSTQGEVICLTRSEGRIRWITQLDTHVDPEDNTSDAIEWTGPVLAGDRLLLVASNGQAWSLSPYTGKPLGRIDLPDASFLPPIVANRTLYLETSDAQLLAFRGGPSPS